MRRNRNLRGYRAKAVGGVYSALREAERYLSTYDMPEVAPLVYKALRATYPYLPRQAVVSVDVGEVVTFNRQGPIFSSYEKVTFASRDRLESVLDYRKGMFSEEREDGTVRWKVMEPESYGIGITENISAMYRRLGVKQ